MRFLYVMDPMCSWCYAFQPELDAFLEKHRAAEVVWIMGGLAPDNTEPMDDNLKQTISSYWHQIEKQSSVLFNHDFWELNTPFRSTYPACRAVIASESLKVNTSQSMVSAIQEAYYRKAENPSFEETLVACACSIGLDKNQFQDVVRSELTEQGLQQHLNITHQLQVSGFPALFYVNDRSEAYPLTLGYCKAEELERNLRNI